MCCGRACAAASSTRRAAAPSSCRCRSGFAYREDDQVILDPDQQVQGAVRLLFATFRRTGSASATVRAFQAARAALPAPGAQRPAPRRGGLAAAAAQHGARRAAQPALRRRLRLRPHQDLQTVDGQCRVTRAAARPVVRPLPGRARGLHHLGGVRGEPAAAARERPRPGPRPPGEPAARGAGAAAGAGDLRTLRRADGRALPPAAGPAGARLRLPAGDDPAGPAPCQRVPGGAVDAAIGELLVHG